MILPEAYEKLVNARNYNGIMPNDAVDVILGATCETCRHYRPETQSVYGTCQVNSDAVWIETEMHTEKSHGCRAWQKRGEQS